MGLVALFAGLGRAEIAFFSLSSIAIVTFLILRNILPVRRFGVALYAERPLAVYSAFYFLYYVAVYFLAFFSARIPTHNEAKIAVLILLGYLGVWCGLAMNGKSRRGPIRLTFSQAQAMFLVAYFCVAMVLVHYTWLFVAMAYYYTHAKPFTQPATVAASFAYVFAGSFDLPLILLLGLLTKVNDPALARRARRFLWAYVPVLLFVFITRSQFRLTVTALVFVLMSVQLGRAELPKLRYWAMVGALSALALVVIQAARFVVSEKNLSSSDDQVLTSARASLAGLRPALNEREPEIETSVLQRATLPTQFLSDIIDATDGGRPHTHGAVALETIKSFLPRAMWPGKPTIVSTQLRIERELGLPELDNSPGPINEFYAEFGALGVVLGYAAFGWLLGFLTRSAMSSNRVLGWFILFWLWSAVAIVETDLISGVLTAFRQALVVYLIYRLSLYFVALKRRQPAAFELPAAAL